MKEKVKEVDNEAEKEHIDEKKMSRLKNWFKNNAPYLKSVIDFITTLLKLAKSG